MFRFNHKRGCFWLAGLGLVAFAGCRSAGSGVRLSGPASFGSAPSGAHVIGHKPGTCDLCDLYYRVRSKVVRLSTDSAMGAGFVVGRAGTIMTNKHVVADDDAPTVETYSGRTFTARTVRRDEDVDLALVAVDPPSGDWEPMPVEPGALPEVGGDVYVIGHPVGLGWTITRGIVSAVRKPGEIAPFAMIQTDAAISPGNSGGPLLNRHGQLIGVVVSKLAGPGIESVGFAIPVSQVASFLAGAKHGGS